MQLIKTPLFSMKSLVTGMGTFWGKISKEILLDALYQTSAPSPENAINSLVYEENTSQEGKVITWLHRFIRSCSKEQLIKFIRFVTGAPIFTLNMKTKVNFIDQKITFLRRL